MTDPTARQWSHSGGVRGALDGSTAVVVLLWLGILLLVPSRPSGEEAAPPPPPCMISAWSEPLHELPLARRPDLVTLPSSVSFGAGGPAVNSLQGVPPLRRYAGKPLPPVVVLDAWDDNEAAADVLRRAAAEGLLRPVAPVLPEERQQMFPVSKTGWVVVGSQSLGDTCLSDGFKDSFRLPVDIKRFDADLWIQFDEQGRPIELFIEKTENRALAQDLVRQLWNPANWMRAAGKGRMTIRYLAGTGGTNANTTN
jgi:hypothetical protein